MLYKEKMLHRTSNVIIQSERQNIAIAWYGSSRGTGSWWRGISARPLKGLASVASSSCAIIPELAPAHPHKSVGDQCTRVASSCFRDRRADSLSRNLVFIRNLQNGLRSA
jgi:hypothetical protein